MEKIIEESYNDLKAKACDLNLEYFDCIEKQNNIKNGMDASDCIIGGITGGLLGLFTGAAARKISSEPICICTAGAGILVGAIIPKIIQKVKLCRIDSKLNKVEQEKVKVYNKINNPNLKMR